MSGEAITVLVDAVKALGVLDVRVTIRPGHTAIALQVETAAEVAEVAARFGMPAPELVTNGINEWWQAERGESESESEISVIGGHRPVCQCHAGAARKGG